MSLQAFQKLTHVLGKDIVIDESHSPVLEHIPPEIVIAVGLQYLIGGKCLDLKTAYGLSLSSVYRCRNLFILAVNRCPELDIRMPITRAKMEKVAKDFAAVSTGNLVGGCVGCIDGFLAGYHKTTDNEGVHGKTRRFLFWTLRCIWFECSGGLWYQMSFPVLWACRSWKMWWPGSFWADTPVSICETASWQILHHWRCRVFGRRKNVDSIHRWPSISF